MTDIDKTLRQLGLIWKRYPTLRLGQLLLNSIPENKLYYISDETLIQQLWTTTHTILKKTHHEK